MSEPWKSVTLSEVCVKLSCRANEEPGTLVEETTHAEDELAMKSCQPRKEMNHRGESTDVVSGRCFWDTGQRFLI